jgi:hypothetical protein
MPRKTPVINPPLSESRGLGMLLDKMLAQRNRLKQLSASIKQLCGVQGGGAALVPLRLEQARVRKALKAATLDIKQTKKMLDRISPAR